MIHKNPNVAVMQDAVTSAYATRNKKKKKKALLCLGLGRTPEILYAALGLKINPSPGAIGQRRVVFVGFFFSEGQPCCAGTRPEPLITRLKLVGTLAAPQPPNTLF